MERVGPPLRQRQGTELGEASQQFHVVQAVGRCPLPIEQLQDADDIPVGVGHRNGKDRIGEVADLLGDVPGMARVLLRVGNSQRLPGDGHQPGDAAPEGEGELLQLRRGLPDDDVEGQHPRLPVDQHQRPLGRGDRGGRGAHQPVQEQVRRIGGGNRLRGRRQRQRRPQCRRERRVLSAM